MASLSAGKATVLGLTLLISVLFFALIKPFLMTILLAAITAGLAQPPYRWLHRRCRERSVLASLGTMALLLAIVILPLLAMLGLVAAQAIEIGQQIQPWVEEQLGRGDELSEIVARLPWIDRIDPYREQILEKLGTIVQAAGSFMVNSLSHVTAKTVLFFFHFFLFLYATFFFLMDGSIVLRRVLCYLPLRHDDELKLVDRFLSVSRATLKGTFIIGLVQGVLGGLAFHVVGFGGAAFWGALMVVLSIIPGIGTGLIWIPAVVILGAEGRLLAAALMTLWFALVVGTADNLLRPRLVGRDTQMHDLMILFSTLGGIALFGVAGFIIGPIVAALFITMWDIYGVVFREDLPPVGTFDR
jgi:predicted PurR-regulated permease PerM